MDFKEYIKHFEGSVIGVRMPNATKEMLEEIGEAVVAESKRVLGTYEYGWKPLKPSTIMRKNTGNSPLLETRELHDSIEVLGSPDMETKTIRVGSANPKALWHELGTSRVPARPFLSPAPFHIQEQIHKIAGEHLYEVIGVNAVGTHRSMASSLDDMSNGPQSPAMRQQK